MTINMPTAKCSMNTGTAMMSTIIIRMRSQTHRANRTSICTVMNRWFTGIGIFPICTTVMVTKVVYYNSPCLDSFSSGGSPHLSLQTRNPACIGGQHCPCQVRLTSSV